MNNIENRLIASQAKDFLASSQFKLHFEKELEEQYQTDIIESRILHLLFFYSIGIFLYFFYLFIDANLLGENFYKSVVIRSTGGIIAGIFILCFYLARHSKINQWVDSITVVAVLYTAFSVLYIENLATPENLALYGTGTMIVTLYYNIVIQQRFYHAIFCSISIFIVFLVNRVNVIGIADPHTPLALADHASVTGLSLTARYLMDRSHRKNYAQNFILELRAQKLQEISITDPLTNIYNRRHFSSEAHKAFKQAERKGTNISILFIDIDYFKKYNDHYGHQKGDSCIVDVTKNIKNSLRESDLLARYGGEEFVVLIQDSTEKEATLSAERILTSIRNMRVSHEKSEILPYITVSIGIASSASFKKEDRSYESITQKADNALYLAKKRGRNRAVTYSTTVLPGNSDNTVKH